MEELRRLLIAFRFRLLDEQVEKAAAKKGLTVGQVNETSRGHRRNAYRSKIQAEQKQGGES